MLQLIGLALKSTCLSSLSFNRPASAWIQKKFPSAVSAGPVSLCNLKPPFGMKDRKRFRSIVHGGRTNGRGNGGQKSRSGCSLPRGFEGGQTPLHKRLPKFGIYNAFQKEYSEVNLDRIQHLINTGRLNPSKSITIRDLHDAGITGFKDGIKILGGGAFFLTTPITIYATRFTKEAIKRIEEIGGKAISIYYTKLGFRALLKPEKFLRPIRFAAPVRQKDLLFYWDYENRGYLSKQIMEFMKTDPSIEFERHVIAKRAYTAEQLEHFKTIGEDVSDKLLMQYK